MESALRILLVFLMVLVLVDAQYRMMANYGPAWRQKMWRKTRVPSQSYSVDSSGLFDMLA